MVILSTTLIQTTVVHLPITITFITAFGLLPHKGSTMSATTVVARPRPTAMRLDPTTSPLGRLILPRGDILLHNLAQAAGEGYRYLMWGLSFGPRILAHTAFDPAVRRGTN